jgi:hypothetical protein
MELIDIIDYVKKDIDICQSKDADAMFDVLRDWYKIEILYNNFTKKIHVKPDRSNCPICRIELTDDAHSCFGAKIPKDQFDGIKWDTVFAEANKRHLAWVERQHTQTGTAASSQDA